MVKQQLIEYMDMWARSMKVNDHQLGYPKKSILFATGGASTTFDDMLDDVDSRIIKTIDAVVSSLSRDQREAVWARWLNTKEPMYYEYKLELAIDNLMVIVDRRLGM